MPARVFLSYTTHPEDGEGPPGLCTRVSEALFARLQAEGYAPFRDRDRVEAGEPWEQPIAASLFASHGAVVLLTPRSLASDWVFREANFLATRRALLPQFKVVWLLLGGASLATLPDRWTTLGLDAVQCRTVTEADAVEVAVDALRPVRDRWEDRTPEDRLLDRVAGAFKDVSGRELVTLLTDLTALTAHDPQDAWFTELSYREALARALADTLALLDRLVQTANVLVQVRSWFPPSTAPADQQLAWMIVHQLSALRVDGRGALRLRELAGARPPRAMAGLGARDAALAELYLRRASATDDFWSPVRVTNRGADPDAIVGEVRRALVDRLGLDGEDELQDELDLLAGVAPSVTDPPLVVLVPGPLLPQALTALRAAFPPVCFVVLDPDLAAACPPGVELLEAPLDEAAESALLKDLQRARRRILSGFGLAP